MDNQSVRQKDGYYNITIRKDIFDEKLEDMVITKTGAQP
jgi:hypothetical protein